MNEKLDTSDDETVEQICENSYLKYFLGVTDYRDEGPFHPTMFVHFRRRLEKKVIYQLIETENQKVRGANKSKNDDDKVNIGGSIIGKKSNKDKLLIDITCASADIIFLTDLKMLNDVRRKIEKNQ